jgi:hypothetical protein
LGGKNKHTNLQEMQLKNILFSAGIGLLIFCLQQLGFKDYIHPEIWSIYVFYVAFSVLFHRLISQGMANDRDLLVQFFTITIIAKFVLSLVFVGVFLYLKTPQVEAFIGNFFALYLLYTTFEIWNLYRNLRQNW